MRAHRLTQLFSVHLCVSSVTLRVPTYFSKLKNFTRSNSSEK